MKNVLMLVGPSNVGKTEVGKILKELGWKDVVYLGRELDRNRNYATTLSQFAAINGFFTEWIATDDDVNACIANGAVVIEVVRNSKGVPFHFGNVTDYIQNDGTIDDLREKVIRVSKVLLSGRDLTDDAIYRAQNLVVDFEDQDAPC